MAGVEENNVALLDEPPVISAGPDVRLGHRYDHRCGAEAADRAGLAGGTGGRNGTAGAPRRDGDLPVAARRRHLGHRNSGGVGLRHHQLCVVDRYWPRGHADFGHSFAVQADVAQFDQPFRRGDDAVCGGLRGNVSTAAHGPSVAGLLDVPVPELDGSVAAVPQSAGVGRVRGFDVRDDFGGVLVCGPGAGLRHHARRSDAIRWREGLRHAVAGLARVGAALDAV